MKIKAVNLILLLTGLIIAGFATLVYGFFTKIGNATMIKGAIYATTYALIILSFGYIYVKGLKVDTMLEITKNSINIIRSKNS